MDTVKRFIGKNKWIAVFLLMIPFFNDSYENFRIVPDWIMDYLKIAVFLLLTVTLLFIRKKRPSALLISLIVMEAGAANAAEQFEIRIISAMISDNALFIQRPRGDHLTARPEGRTVKSNYSLIKLICQGRRTLFQGYRE